MPTRPLCSGPFFAPEAANTLPAPANSGSRDSTATPGQLPAGGKAGGTAGGPVQAQSGMPPPTRADSAAKRVSGFFALPDTAQQLVLCSLSANDLWSLCSATTRTRDVVQHSFHLWIKDAPLWHAVAGQPGGPPLKPNAVARPPTEANLPLAFLAFVLGLGNPSLGSEQWRSFRKVFRRYGSSSAIPSPLTLQDVANAKGGPPTWGDPKDWNSPAYDHLWNELPAYLTSRPLPLRIREAFGQLSYSMVYWLTDSGGDPLYLRRWPKRNATAASGEDKMLQGAIAGHFCGTVPPRTFEEIDKEAEEPDDPDEKPSPHFDESPVIRFLRIKRYLDRCWKLIWRFGGPPPSEILRSFKATDEDGPPAKRARSHHHLELHAHSLDAFRNPSSICSKNLYPRILLNLIKRGDYRTLEMMLVCFGRPEKEWRTDLRRRAQIIAAANAAAVAAVAAGGDANNVQLAVLAVAANMVNGANNVGAFLAVAGMGDAGSNDNTGGKDSCADGGLRFHRPTPPPGAPPNFGASSGAIVTPAPPMPAHPQWIVWFSQKGSGGPHLGHDGNWERSHPLCAKIEDVLRYHGGILGRAPVLELPPGVLPLGGGAGGAGFDGPGALFDVDA